MRVLTILCIALMTTVMACKKEVIATDTTPVVLSSTDTVLYSGSFTNGQHAVSGSSKIIKSAGNKRFLLIENLATDAGPDLRIRLATDRANGGSTEISATVKNGNAKLEIPTSVNISTQKFALVWCQQYSVLFGSAEMK